MGSPTPPAVFPRYFPSDYYLFWSMAHGLADQQFRSYEDIEKWLVSWIASKNEHFYRNGIRALPEIWSKVVANNGQYSEWFIFNHFFTIKLHFHQKISGNLDAHLIYGKLTFLKHVLISIENIYDWAGRNLAERIFIEGERVLNAGHIIKCGKNPTSKSDGWIFVVNEIYSDKYLCLC